MELGVKFRSDVSGRILGIRFYKGASNTGTHIGNLWSASGTLLARATFTNETASGWQQVNFATPVSITANTTYVASYYAPAGHYAFNRDYFTSSGVDRGSLHALSNTAAGGNGVYLYGSGSAFPVSTYYASNYWVDVVFDSTGGSNVSSLWSASDTPAVAANTGDSGAVELGVKFRSDVSGRILGIRFYKGASNLGTHIGNLWTSSGTLLATAAFANETSSGWQQVRFATPVAIAANTTYVASYFAPLGNYAVDRNYFANVGVDRTPLHALSNTAAGGNGVFQYRSSSGFPVSTYLASNYWVDVVFDTSATPSTPATLSLTANPATIAFGNVTLGSSSTNAVTLTNSGTGSVTVSQATVSGAGFSVSGLSLPVTLAAGQSATLQAKFAPTAAGSASGSISVVSTAGNSPTVIALSGTGAASSLYLTANPSSVAFGAVLVGSTASQSVYLNNTGSGSVTISQATVTGAGFSITGLSLPQTLAAGQSTSFRVTFAPQVTGNLSGTVTITSNASNSPVREALSGSGTVSHSVSLSWAPSTSPNIIGYNVLRSTASGGPYTALNLSPVTGTSYTDALVQAGLTYYYVTTAVDSASHESIYSNQARATVPSP